MCRRSGKCPTLRGEHDNEHDDVETRGTGSRLPAVVAALSALGGVTSGTDSAALARHAIE